MGKGSKQSRKEGNRVACLIKKNKAEYYISDVDVSSKDDMISTMNSINQTLGKMKSSYIIIGSNDSQIFVLCYIPDCVTQFTTEEWINASSLGLEGTIELEDNYSLLIASVDSPFKMKSTVKSNGFAFLYKMDCIEEESESEEFIGFDDI